MKPPLTWYGGKQSIAPQIVGLFPAHNIYVEAFAGGATCFFVKPQSAIEVLNDTNQALYNFYLVLKKEQAALKGLVDISVHSRFLFNRAKAMIAGEADATNIERAWALWYLSKTSFGADLRIFGFTKSGDGNKIARRILTGAAYIVKTDWGARMVDTTLECDDALKVIKRFDTPETLFYLDPPYVGTNCGSYDGYTELQYGALLALISTINGKFCLSSYPNPQLEEAAERNGWRIATMQTFMRTANTAANRPDTAGKSRVEWVVMNYGESLSTGGGAGLFL